tara:strand:+ start:1528 stop:1761 length:234 start_codon:yes stop_codon:yes gene_type:complete
MSATDYFFLIADVFQWTFQIFELIGNMVNFAFILLIFGGLCYWMAVQNRLNGLADVPAEIKDAEEWYKEGSNKSQLK